MNSDALADGARTLVGRSWLVVALALLVGGVTYLTVAVGEVETEGQAIIGLSQAVDWPYFAQERDAARDRALTAGLPDGVASGVTVEIEPTDEDITRLLVTARGADPEVNAREANNVADSIVALSVVASNEKQAAERERLEDLFDAALAEREGWSEELTEAVSARNSGDPSAVATAIQVEAELRSVERLIGELRDRQVELDLLEPEGSTVVVSRARADAVMLRSPVGTAVLGAFAGAAIGLLLALGIAIPARPSEVADTGSNENFEDADVDEVGDESEVEDLGDDEADDEVLEAETRKKALP